VNGLVTLLGARHGERLAQVLAASSFLVEAVHAEPDDVLPAGATVDVLPPFAGG
jgi:molybdopterin synthase sulfur carrier subunit